jgi:hypothetical protein
MIFGRDTHPALALERQHADLYTKLLKQLDLDDDHRPVFVPGSRSHKRGGGFYGS